MCQAFEGEQSFMEACCKDSRGMGYRAYQAGLTLDDVPTNLSWTFDPDSWKVGFYLAEKGAELF